MLTAEHIDEPFELPVLLETTAEPSDEGVGSIEMRTVLAEANVPLPVALDFGATADDGIVSAGDEQFQMSVVVDTDEDEGFGAPPRSDGLLTGRYGLVRGQILLAKEVFFGHRDTAIVSSPTRLTMERVAQVDQRHADFLRALADGFAAPPLPRSRSPPQPLGQLRSTRHVSALQERGGGEVVDD